MKKANGDGSVYYERDRKKYCAAVTDKSGKRVRKRFDTMAEAKKWIKSALADIDEDEFVAPSKYTVLQWVMDYIEFYKKPNVKPSTLDKALYIAGKCKPIGNIKLQDLTPMDVQRLYIMIDHYSASIKHAIHILLKEAYRAAALNGLVKKNIMELVPYPKGKVAKIEIFTDDELARLEEVCNRRKHWKCIFLLALQCGLRRGEILGLQIEDVYEDYIFVRHNLTALRGTSTLSTPKTQRSIRKIPITDVLKESLAECIGDRTTGYVLLSKMGTHISAPNFNRYWWQKMNMAKVERKHFHAFRHTFATKMLAAGVPVANVSALLGHSTPNTTYKVYAHAVPELDKSMTQIISNAVSFKSVAPTVAPTPNK